MVECKKCKKNFKGQTMWKDGKCRVCYETDQHVIILEDAFNSLLGKINDL
jgi:protein-arginine kinase activator protein McsA